MRLRINTKTVAPRIDQMIGNDRSPILTGSNSGSPNRLAIKCPNSAPMNPIAIDTRQPPRLKPTRAWATDPQMPATKRRIKNDTKSTVLSPSALKRAKPVPACFD
jgi:hypothetical protein